MIRATYQPGAHLEVAPDSDPGAGVMGPNQTLRVDPAAWLRGSGIRDDRRMWGALASRSRRPRPPEGFDVAGDWFAGVLARRKARRLDWIRAKAISARARQLQSSSDAVLNEEIADAREAAITRRDDPAAVDHAFSIITEALRREIGLTLHIEQLLGALALARGCCAELATGEGKTVTAILPAALDGWSGRGVHVITVNDYLARRDAQTTSPVYHRLNLRVGVVQESSTHDQRRAAYAADITYASDKQAIFDYLRDRLQSPLAPRLAHAVLDDIASPLGAAKPNWQSRVVHRGFYAAIVDEADSVLIDDAVTPAIIAGPAGGDETRPPEVHRRARDVAARLTPDLDFTIDPRLRRVNLTPLGRERLAQLARDLPADWAGPRRREELINTALTARMLFKPGEDYLVKDDEVHIIDRSTGRVLPGRQWQQGLHQAVQAKEGVTISNETTILARSSYQAYFQRYTRLSGMTGTAREVARELWGWYRLPIVPVPTHKRMLRKQRKDAIFETEEAKLEAVAQRVAEAHAMGRPVLVGAWSVTTSEAVAELLRAKGIACQVLNANREAEEAAIIEHAGEVGAVTVATNMAGRGTDIRLTPESRALGGLLVIATERHDEARVDRQLAGRSGRQGDPGAVEPFVSLEDQLIRRHGPGWLVALTRLAGPGLRAPLASALWGIAQRTASAKWMIQRSQSTKADAWFEMAMHTLSR